jgi:hypothetical protein
MVDYELDRSCDPEELGRFNQFLKSNLPEKIKQDIQSDLNVLPDWLQQTILERLDTIVQIATDRLFIEFSGQEKQPIARSAEDQSNDPDFRNATMASDENFPTSGTNIGQFLSQTQNVFPEVLQSVDLEKGKDVNTTQELVHSNGYPEHLNREDFNLDEYQNSFVLPECADGHDPFPQLLSSLGPLGFGHVGAEALGFSY